MAKHFTDQMAIFFHISKLKSIAILTFVIIEEMPVGYRVGVKFKLPLITDANIDTVMIALEMCQLVLKFFDL